MKIRLIQPLYEQSVLNSEQLFEWELKALEDCTEDLDLIILPESSDVPCYAAIREERDEICRKFNGLLIERCSATAKRCSSMLCVNARCETPSGPRNTTYLFDRQGNIAGKYFKQHLTPGETTYLDSSYTWEYEPVTFVDLEGIRFAFLTCYDFYFYESFAAIARVHPDIILGCSHQRTDTRRALEMMSQCCAYNTNAYVVRASVSLGEDSELGGCSMVVAPDATVLCDMGSRVGYETVEIDPHKKLYKPAGFKNPECSHFEYTEKGRRPWKYRPAGPGICLTDDKMPYIRVCAHRGFNTVAPENSMPAFGAAVALGADEIEFDLWPSADGEVVSTHDARLERVSNGEGMVWTKTVGELKRLDFGSKFSEPFTGLRLPTFEEILREFSCRTVMNIHIKTSADPSFVLREEWLVRIVALVRQYDCEKHMYFMSGDDAVLGYLQKNAPDLPRCCGYGKNHADDQVVRGLRYGCSKIQVFKDCFTPELIARAHDNGMKVTAFFADTPQKAKWYLDQGADTILTNDYLRISDYIRNVYPFEKQSGKDGQV